jgi:hypothetical protein
LVRDFQSLLEHTDQCIEEAFVIVADIVAKPGSLLPGTGQRIYWQMRFSSPVKAFLIVIFIRHLCIFQ